MTRTVRVTDGIEWLSWCHGEEHGAGADAGDADRADGEETGGADAGDVHGGRARHMHLGQYLIDGAEGYVLVDAGEGHGDDLNAAIDEATGGEGIDAVMLTHAILPHTGNLEAIREAWADATVISSVGNPPAVGLDGAEPRFTGERETVAGERFTFVDPLITDVVVSTWIYHHDSKTMFTAEGLGHYHAPGECSYLSSDYGDGIPYEYVLGFARDKLKFLDFVDPGKLRIGFDNLLSEYDVERFAPTHGAPIVREDVESYAESLVRAAGEFDYAPGHAPETD